MAPKINNTTNQWSLKKVETARMILVGIGRSSPSDLNKGAKLGMTKTVMTPMAMRIAPMTVIG